jgi:hypothetical protein
MRSPSGRRLSVQLASMDRSESTTLEIVSAGDLTLCATTEVISQGHQQSAMMQSHKRI